MYEFSKKWIFLLAVLNYSFPLKGYTVSKRIQESEIHSLNPYYNKAILIDHFILHSSVRSKVATWNSEGFNSSF